MAFTVYDTITYSRNVLADDPAPELLQERYFPTDPKLDVFQTSKVVLDYADADLKRGAFVKRGYVDGNTTVWRSREVEPLRIGISDTVDPAGQDRVLFEQLMYPQGDTRPTRADALNQLVRLKAARLVTRAQRSIETLIAAIFMDNGLGGTIPTSPTDPTPVDVSISYAPEGGNDQRYAPAVAWGEEGATPYRDVTKMIDVLLAHGGEARDLLISPEAWQILRSDPEFKDRFALPSNQYEGELFARTIQDARHVGIGDFGGYLLDIVVYYRKYADASGALVPILPPGFVCVTRPGVGRTLCGGSVMLDREMIAVQGEIESSFVQRMGKFIASKSMNFDLNTLEVRIESRPLPAPYRPWGWITMDAMNSNSLAAGEAGRFANLTLDSVADDATYDGAALPIKNWARNAKVGASIAVDTTKFALPGYTFEGLTDDEGTPLPVSEGAFTLTPSASYVIAGFKSVISFDENGGAGSMEAFDVPYGGTSSLPACTLSKTGAAFEGWALSASGAVAYEDAGLITPSGDMTLYAVWSE